MWHGSGGGERPHKSNHAFDDEAEARGDGFPAEIGAESGGEEHGDALGGTDEEGLLPDEDRCRDHMLRERGPEREAWLDHGSSILVVVR